MKEKYQLDFMEIMEVIIKRIIEGKKLIIHGDDESLCVFNK